MSNLIETQKIIPEHAKKIALAKMDLMKQGKTVPIDKIASYPINSLIIGNK